MPSTPQGHYHIPFQYIPLFIKALSEHSFIFASGAKWGCSHTLENATLFCSVILQFSEWFCVPHSVSFLLQDSSDFLLLLPPFLHLFVSLVLGAVIKKNAHFISVGYKTGQKTVRKVCFLFQCASQHFDNRLFVFVVLSIAVVVFSQTEKRLKLSQMCQRCLPSVALTSQAPGRTCTVDITVILFPRGGTKASDEKVVFSKTVLQTAH